MILWGMVYISFSYCFLKWLMTRYTRLYIRWTPLRWAMKNPGLENKAAVREATTICPAPVTLTF